MNPGSTTSRLSVPASHFPSNNRDGNHADLVAGKIKECGSLEST